MAERQDFIQVCTPLLEQHAVPADQLVFSLFDRGATHVGFPEHHLSPGLHRLIISLLPPLAARNIRNLCLELPSTLQRAVDTGDQYELMNHIKQEEQVLRRNWGKVAQGVISDRRVFHDILPLARELGIHIITLDSKNKIGADGMGVNRNAFMANNVPVVGKSLIYIGAEHLKKDWGVPLYFYRRSGIDMFSLMCIQQGVGYPHELAIQKVVRESPTLSRLKMFAVDLRTPGIQWILDSRITEGNIQLKEIQNLDPTLFKGDGFVYYVTSTNV